MEIGAGQINIEITSSCNARCIICPHKSMKRPEGKMSDTLLTKILDGCGNRPMDIHYHLNGESLLDSRLPSIIAYGRSKNPRSKHTIYTNGSLLGKRADEFFSHPDSILDDIYISFDGGTKEIYEMHRVGLNFEQTLDSIRQFIKKRNVLGLKRPKIHLLMVLTRLNEHTKKRFNNLWKDLLIDGLDSISFAAQMNWAGDIDRIADYPYPKSPRCPLLFNHHVFILYTGDAVMCCLDCEGREIVGDANIQTVHEIADGQRYEELRKLFAEGNWDKLPLCGKCSYGKV